MKKIIYLFLAIGLITACNTNQPVRYTSSSPEIDAFKSSIKHYLEQNWDEYRQHYADTVKFRNNVTKDKEISLDSVISNWKQENMKCSQTYIILPRKIILKWSLPMKVKPG
jgi:hypothetical protein